MQVLSLCLRCYFHRGCLPFLPSRGLPKLLFYMGVGLTRLSVILSLIVKLGSALFSVFELPRDTANTWRAGAVLFSIKKTRFLYTVWAEPQHRHFLWNLEHSFLNCEMGRCRVCQRNTVGIWAGSFFVAGTVPCAVGRLVASLASTQ